MSKCICNNKGNAPYWHLDECPASQPRCDQCDGMGYSSVTLGCGCCSDTETCEGCHGTGIPATNTADPCPTKGVGDYAQPRTVLLGSNGTSGGVLP